MSASHEARAPRSHKLHNYWLIYSIKNKTHKYTQPLHDVTNVFIYIKIER